MSAPSKHDKRVVPWFSRKEFDSVYNGLYSKDTYSQRYAVGKVTVWRCRATNKLPVAIDCTADLVSSSVDHRLTMKARSIGVEEYKIRSAYALALIRFVNHITEKGQNKQFAQPVHLLAGEFGLPEWLVDLRHESTHGVLPSLSMLSEGVKWALNWLKREYWEKQTSQEEVVSTDTEQQPNEGYIRDVLVNFQQIQFEEEGIQGFSSPEFKQIFADMEQLFASDRISAVSCVVDDGYLLTTPDQLEALGSTSEDLLNCADCLDLPETLVAFWKPVLKLLHHLNSTPLLLQFLCNEITENHSLRDRLIAGWVHEITQANENAAYPGTDPDFNKRLYKSPCGIPWHTLFDVCVHRPSKYTTLLVKSFIPKLKSDLSSEDGKQITALMELYANTGDFKLPGKVSGTAGSDSDQTFTVSDLVGETHEQRSKNVSKNMEIISSPWQLCTDAIDWSQYPFGLLPNQQISSLNFDLPELENHTSQDESVDMESGISEQIPNTGIESSDNLERDDDDNDDDIHTEPDLNSELMQSKIHLL